MAGIRTFNSSLYGGSNSTERVDVSAMKPVQAICLLCNEMYLKRAYNGKFCPACKDKASKMKSRQHRDELIEQIKKAVSRGKAIHLAKMTTKDIKLVKAFYAKAGFLR
jgi:hypothetical protein